MKNAADRYQVGIAEVATKYILQKPLVAGAIIGARNCKHLEKIQKIKSFELDEHDLNTINAVISKSKGLQGGVYELERQKDGKHARIMRYNLTKNSTES